LRLIHRDPKTGRLRLRLETPSDLWRIARLVQPGDRVGASTTRRDPEAPADTPAAQRERRRVWLTLAIEQVEFHGFSRHVRVTGPIIEGPFDLGKHHTLDLAEGDELTVDKAELTSSDRALLDEGIQHRGDHRIVIAAVDWGESTILRVRDRSIEPVAEVNRSISGKRYRDGTGERDRRRYVEELSDLLRREAPQAEAILVAGPGFLKEELARHLIEKEPALKSKIRVYPTAEAGGVGVQELLRSGRASEVLSESVAAQEADLVERLVTALGGGKRAAVGIGEVEEALRAGAVETLLVHESMLRDSRIQPLLDVARAGRGAIFVVRDEGEAGRRLAGLGRIGALLRYDFVPTSGRRRTAGGVAPASSASSR
jgi:protein pelota